MPIATAVERGSTIYVYDEKGRTLCTIPIGDGLHGYTSGSVSVRRGSTIYTYDEKGRTISTTPAK